MESNGDGNRNRNRNGVAPFVMKTFQILSDPNTNRFIAWGTANNTFIVLEPLHFSHTVLPLYFNHNNFSSFVRQLNTYGFRKVDPDRWEFANEWFLRGQMQLLNKIVRRKSRTYTSIVIKHDDEGEDDDGDDYELVMEIAKLRYEQASIEEELQRMNLRLQATERRPRQMVTFLCKVVEDPQTLPQIMLNKENARHLSYDSSSMKREIMVSSSSSSSSSSSGVAIDHSYATLSSPSIVSSSDGECGGGGAAAPSTNGSKECDGGDGISSSYFEALVAGEMATEQPAPYPFSLLDGGF